jgi:APA family basic amino acid/polyamine antiporter
MLIYNLYGTNWGIALAATTLTGAFAFPGSDMSIGVTVGAALVVFNAMGTAFLAAAMPRSGGDYIWDTYTLNHFVGFLSGWGFFMNVSFAVGLYAALTVNYGASATFANLGLLFHNAYLSSLGAAAATSNWTFIFGTLAIWVSVPFFLVGPKIARWFMWVIFIPCVIGIILALGLLFTATHASFVSSFNSAMAPYTNSSNSYQSVLNTATSAGGILPAVSILASITALPLGFWAFVGYNQSVVLAGETKSASKSQPIAILLSLFLTWAIYASAFRRFYDVVGFNFNSAVAYLYYVAPSKYPLPVPPTFNFFVSLLTNNPIISILIGISFILWIFMLIGPLFLQSSRYLFNWSFNRVAPAAFGSVNNRGSPQVAVLISAAVAELFLGLYVYSGVLGIVNYTMIWAIIFCIDGFAMLLFPFRRKDLFNLAPGFVKAKIGPVPLLTIFGAINIAFFAFIVYFSILTPAFSGPVGLGSYSLIVGIFLSGIIIYSLAYAIRKRQGIDISAISKEIPPE